MEKHPYKLEVWNLLTCRRGRLQKVYTPALLDVEKI